MASQHARSVLLAEQVVGVLGVLGVGVLGLRTLAHSLALKPALSAPTPTPPPQP